MSNYNYLIEKLDAFVRKYYLNRLIRGSLYAIAIIVALFLIFNLLEHQFYFSTGVRKSFFYSFIGISGVSLLYFVMMPLFNYFKLGKVISHEQAAQIIGTHFGNVQDKLLNILQLKQQSLSQEENQLIEASINQKSDKIKLVPFKTAINLSSNKKYLKYALPPLLLLLVLLFAAPSLIKDSTHRILNNNLDFEKEAPFHFKINNNKLEVEQYENYVLDINIDGDVMPQKAFINFDGFQYRLDKVNNNTFSYTFNNIQKTTDFKLNAGSVTSKEFELEVLPKPNVSDFELELNYPNYLKRTNESLYNIGDISVPQGTKITWTFNTEHTDQVQVKFDKEKENRAADKKGDDSYRFTKKAMSNDFYKIFFSNLKINTPDSVAYGLNVIADQYPSIDVEKIQDSTQTTLLYFIGNATDDYGLTELSFHYAITNQKGATKTNEVVQVKKPIGRSTQYDHIFDIESLALEPGDNVNFYFQVKDNDGVNGRKAAKTGKMTFSKSTIKEFKDLEDLNEDEISKKVEESIKETKEIQEDLKKLREKLLQKKNLDWQDQQELEKLLEKQKKLDEEIRKAKEKFEELLKNQEEFTERSEEILEKQEKIEEMFEEVMNNETQELMQKIEELMQELNKDELLEEMENMEFNDETMEKELERLQELLKNLELEKELQDQIEELEKLAKEQEELSEKTEKEEESQEELKEEQKEINEKFEDLKEKMEEIEKKNEELSQPKDLGEKNEEKMEEISEELEKSEEELEKKENEKAAKKQKEASKKMQEMAGSLQQSMQACGSEKASEDLDAIRQLLENLVTLSFDQEDLVSEFSKTSKTTPRYVSLVQNQFKLKDDFGIIRDSLESLSKRVDQIASFVTEKVAEVDRGMEKSIVHLEDRKAPEASEYQRRTMKNLNDLALMLSESMEQMQQQMAGMMSGDQMCDNPGQGKGKSGKVPKDKISEGQQQLNKDMQKMQQGQGEGKGGPKAKDFAQAAARQAALRKALEQMKQDKSEQGKGTQDLQKIIDDMNKVEIDLVNKRFDAELLSRQQDIETRLLEAEKADRQREWDNKRKAERTKEKKKELPIALQEYLKKREAEVELYNKVSPSLKPFYQYMVNEYYNELKKDN